MSNAIKQQYNSRIESYERLAKTVSESLQSLIDENSIEAALEFRAKTLDSFLKKIEKKSYQDPIEEMSDLAGVRVICNFEKDIDRVANLVSEEFLSIEDIDKTRKLDTNKMGYSGRHIVVKLGPKYGAAHHKNLQDLKCEIQIRTVFQHAWSVVEHSLVYKNEAAIPDRLRRKINHVSSMMEIAQSIFEEVLQEKEKYKQEIQNEASPEKDKDAKNLMNLPIDYETLSLYSRAVYPELQESINLQNKLLNDLNKDRYRVIRDIEQVRQQSQEFLEWYKKQNPDFFKFSTDYITKSLGLTDEEFRDLHGFAQKTKEAFRAYEAQKKLAG